MTTKVNLYLSYQVEDFDAAAELARVLGLAAIFPDANLECRGRRATRGGTIVHDHFGDPTPTTAPPSMPTFTPASSQALEAAEYAAEATAAPKYTCPDHYRELTGKRFRMTKDQRERGLSRDDAFSEYLKENY